jgi:uncharacterized protein with HEPN domain
MNKDDASLLDIHTAAKQVLKFSGNLTKEQLDNNEEKKAAILYEIIVIGEATKRLSESFRLQYSEIPWKDIAGMRDILAHQYDRVNLETLWDAIQKDVPELLTLLEPLLPNIL